MLWRDIGAAFAEAIPDEVKDRERVAFNLVSQFLVEILGLEGEGWETKKMPKKDGAGMNWWVFAK